MTVYDGSLDTNSLKYISSNIPLALGENSLVLTDVSVGSKIDVAHFLGRNISKILVTFNGITGSSNLTIDVNTLERVKVVPEETCDYLLRSWNPNKGYTFLASRSSVGTWNSYSGYGDVEIDSIQITAANLVGAGATVDLILIS